MARIEVREADITKLELDAIANAANTQLRHGGGVAAAISRAGGPEVQAASDRAAPIDLGDAVETTAGEMPAKWVVHAATMELALAAANRVTHDIFAGLTAVDLRAAAGNALVAHPAGILGGVDHQLTGRVERVDTALLQALLDRDVVPVVPPLGFDGEGHAYRLNSDAVAVEAALARIEAGTYGECTDCGAHITAARLHATPEAARCVRCQEKAEQHRRTA